MPHYNNYGNSDYQPRLATKIYALRRDGDLEGARKMAERFIRNGSADDDVMKAYAWTLIDICKKSLNEGKTQEANTIVDYLVGLSRDKFEPQVSYDSFVETLVKSITSLKIKVNPYYAQIQEARQLGQDGDNDKAWEILSKLTKEGHLPVEVHESYGWVIYRYLRDHYKTMTSEQVRGQLRDYIVLKNERPSLLHSQILNFALNYSKEDANFKLPAFLKLWGPDNLRDDDYDDSVGKDGKSIPSLMSRIARVVVDYEPEDIRAFVDLVPEQRGGKFIEMLQDHYFWKIYNSTEGNVSVTTWKLFDQYLDCFSESPASAAHSKVLGLAERVMKEGNAYRFYSFFQRWNPEKLRPDDWKEEKGENDVVYMPLAIKCLKKANDALSSLSDDQIGDLQWLIDLYGVAVSKFPDDDWTTRSKALLHLRVGQLEEAKAIYRGLCLRMGEKFYIWQESAECWDDNEIKIALLCKAISSEKNEDFIGKIRLELASRLIDAGKLEEAAVEIEKYKKHYSQKVWRISPDVNDLLAKCHTPDAETKNNDALYAEYISKAEECAYAEIPFTDVVLVDSWKNKEGKEFLAFTDGDALEFAVNKKRFPILRKSHIGQVWSMKLYNEGKTTPLLVKVSEEKDWGSLPVGYGYVQYVNEKMKVYHIVSSDAALIYEHYDRPTIKTGDFVRFRQYKKRVKDEKKTFFCDITKCESSVALEKFKTRIVAVDDVNESKKLFHFVLGPRLIDGVLLFDQTELRPSVGDCIKIYYVVSTIDDKKNLGRKKKVVEVVKSEATDEVNTNLVKTISGNLELKYRDDDYDWEEPAFAFIGDYYVPKSTLEQYSITEDCHVSARAVYAGEENRGKIRWKVFDIERD